MLAAKRGTIRILCAMLLIGGSQVPCSGQSSHRTALLLASPLDGEELTFSNDIGSIRQALRQRGFASHEIKELSGKLDRTAVLSAIRAMSAAVAGWDRGEVFLYYTGHGWFSGETLQDARPALALGPEPAGERVLYWDELFAAMRLPKGVRLILLPDC